MRAPPDDETRVVFLHASEHRRALDRIQIWRSEVTGREFEVREADSFAPADELARGSSGFLNFATGSPAVTERPLERSERLDRYRRRKMRQAQTAGVRPRRMAGGGWILVALLVLVILWALL